MSCNVFGCFWRVTSVKEVCSEASQCSSEEPLHEPCSGALELNDVSDDPDLFKTAITGDETWVHGYDVETKAQPSQWKHPRSPRTKKAHQVQSNVKVLLTVFFSITMP